MKTARTRFLHPGYFVWLVVPLLLWLGYSTYGLPHLRWSYRFLDQGQGLDPFAERYYLSCTYVGVNPRKDAFTFRPTNGHCPVIKFRKPAPTAGVNQ